MSIFDTLNAVNVNGKTEEKNGLTYLSWAWAWAEVKKAFPDANYTIYERQTEYGAVNYFTDGRTCWVKTGLTINGLEHIEELPVMNFNNKSIPLDSVTSTDVNKAIQRSLTKAAARHGLGLYIYAGEDLPECEQKAEPAKKEEPVKQVPAGKQFTPDKKKSAPALVQKIAAVPGGNPVFDYLKNEKAFMQTRFECSKDQMNTKFKEMRESLIQGGVVEDIPAEKLTMGQAKQLIEAMYANFLSDKDDGK